MSDIREFIDDENRPWGWGVCSSCGHDAEEEDYNPTTQKTVCATCRHDLINCGWLVVEGTDATKALRFHYAEHVKPEQRIVKIRSRRWSQQ